MLTKMLLDYDINTVKPEYRASVAKMYAVRAQILRMNAEISDLRARAWEGDSSLSVEADRLEKEAAKLRRAHTLELRTFFQSAVDLDGMSELFPMFAMALLQHLKVPLPVLLEALGINARQLKGQVEQLRDMLKED